MEGYIYLGEHFDVLNRSIGISDKKIGKSIDPVTRENQYSIVYKLVQKWTTHSLRGRKSEKKKKWILRSDLFRINSRIKLIWF